MKQTTSADILAMTKGNVIDKDVLYKIIQYSKVDGSPAWGGAEFVVHNTPQQGINWIGNWPNLAAVIVKTRIGAYPDDGWRDPDQGVYRYSLKAQKGHVRKSEMANRVLVSQPGLDYPVLLFLETKRGWEFEGEFHVVDVGDRFVDLGRSDEASHETSGQQFDSEASYSEGRRRFASHWIIERSHQAVRDLKLDPDQRCDICEAMFRELYGFSYIEAHHRVPISQRKGEHQVTAKDFAMLCPNCHKAVHLRMRQTGEQYAEIRALLKSRLSHRPA